MYGEDGTERELIYYDVSENKTVTKIITPGRTETRFRLGFTARVEDGKGTNVIDMIETDSPLVKAGINAVTELLSLTIRKYPLYLIFRTT